MRCSVCHRRLLAGARCELHPTTAVPPPPLAEDAGETPRLDGFTVDGVLGSGGFATVFAGRRDDDGRSLAIKRARSPGDPRFTIEAEALTRVGPPAAPSLWARAVDERGRPLLVLERLSGVTLAEWLAAQPCATPPLDQARRLAGALCHAVAQVHAAKVIHRDLKPENAFVCDGTIRLIDFGIARLEDAAAAAGDDVAGAHTATGARLGTATYMAPEQCRGESAVTQAADLYAVGVMLFELFTGRPPFVGDASEVAQAHVARRPPRPSAFASLPAALDEVVRRCLAKEPSERFADATRLAQALDEAFAELGPAVRRGAGPAPRAAAERRAVAMVALEFAETAALLSPTAIPGGARLARVAAGRSVLAFPEDPPAAGVRRAAQAVEQLGAAVRRAVIHVAALRLRPGARAGALTGAALDHVDAWWPPPDSAEPLLLTDAAARLLDGRATRPAARTGWFVLGDDAVAAPDDPPTLRGRERDLGQLIADAATVDATRAAMMTTVVGDIGVGKSRLLEALAPALAERGFLVVRLEAPRPEEQTTSLLRALTRTAFELSAAPGLDEVQRACGERLEAAVAANAWPAIALLFGCAGDRAPALASLDGGGARALAVDAAVRALRWRAARSPLALLVDNGDRADAASLDVLDLAADSPGAAPLYICLAARGALQLRRARLGTGASQRLHELSALDPAAASALARERLHPVEFVPQPVIDRIVEISERVPLHIVEITRLLHASGAIRRHASGEAFYLAPDQLLHADSARVADRLTAAATSALTPELLAVARACAVLDDPFSAAELQQLDDTLEQLGSVSLWNLDVGVALERLERSGLIERRGAAYCFRHPLVRERIEQQAPPALVRQLHHGALHGLPYADNYGGLLRRARHAAGAGARAAAVQAHLQIADRARRQHRYVDAAQHYSAALEWLGPDDAADRARALGGRGKSRYRIDRYADAIDDLRAARALTPAADARAIADLLFEEAIVLDWMGQFAEAAAVAEEAAPIVDALDDEGLRARLQLARGRALARADRLADAVEPLRAADRGAAATGDHETRVIAGILLAMALQASGCPEEAERVFAEVIARCERAGDHVHLAGVYINRQTLWLARGDHASAAADCRRASALAHALGNSSVERLALSCLAHVLYWQGALDEALAPAERSRELGLRFQEKQLVFETLMLARIQAARGELREAAELLTWIDEHCPTEEITPSLRPLLSAVRLFVTGAAAAPWRALLDELPRELLMTDELLEVLWLHARAAVAAGRIADARASVAEARRVAGAGVAWATRFDALAAACCSGGAADGATTGSAPP